LSCIRTRPERACHRALCALTLYRVKSTVAASVGDRIGVSAHMFKSVLVVCVGNICRSPTGEALLKSKLAGRGIEISSAGLGALTGKPVDNTAAQVMATAGYALPDHEARQLTSQLLREHDLILVMERKLLQSVHSIAPEARGKTFLFGKWIGDQEVPDPYRQQLPAFEHVFRILDKAADAWLPYLK